MSMRTLVVGIDGSPASRSALRLALDEAALHGGGVHAVTCWSESTTSRTGTDLPPADSYDHASRIQHKIIFEVTATAQEIHLVVGQIDEGDPGPLLVAAARKADGLLVGASNKGTLARLSGHEVVDYCVRHATVPVVVVPWKPTELGSLDLEAELSHDDDRSAPSFG